MFKILNILCAIGAVINAERIYVAENIACDTEDETIVYYNQFELTCKNSRCNFDYQTNKKLCVADTDCFGLFTCTGKSDYLARDGSLMQCGPSFICNQNFVWPCIPCLKEACITTTYKCDNLNEKLVNILVPFPTTMICPGDTICNKNNVYPCEWCVARDSGSTITTTTPRPGPNCNDGHGKDNPCRRGNDGNRSVYYRCKAVWYWYEYDVISCENLRNDPICRNRVWWCN